MQDQLKTDIISFIQLHPHQYGPEEIREHFISNCYNAKDISNSILALIDNGKVWVDEHWNLYYLEKPLPYCGEG